MKVLLLALALAVDFPTPPIEPYVFSDIQSAAIEGLRQSLLINPNRDVEYGGVVVELPGHLYQISMPRTDNQVMGMNMPRDKLRGFKIVGDFHTHVCGHNPKNGNRILSEQFSPADIAGNNAFKYDGYILDECFGTIYVYRYKDNLNPADGPQKGHVVGFLNEITE